MLMYKVTTRKQKLKPREVPGIAKDLHRKMYEQFAFGNMQPIESNLCGGLLSSLRSRIAERPQNVYLKWRLHKYLSKPKLSSFKVAKAPQAKGEKSIGETTGLMQAVVRIHSLQSLQHIRRAKVKEKGMSFTKEIPVDVQGRELRVEGSLEQMAEKSAKETLEYVVVQKMTVKGKEGPWMIWGFTEETTIDSINREERKKNVESQKKKVTGSAAGQMA